MYKERAEKELEGGEVLRQKGAGRLGEGSAGGGSCSFREFSFLLQYEHYSHGELNSPDQFKNLEEILLVALMIL